MFIYLSSGLTRGSTTVKGWIQSNNNTDCIFEPLLLNHGMRIYPVIRCTNNVRLTSELLLDEQIVAYKAPNTSDTSITLIPNSPNDGRHRYKSTPVQSDTSKLSFRWDGIHEDAVITKYETRLIGEGQPNHWMDVGLHTYQTIEDDFKPETSYDFEVKGVNDGNISSSFWNLTVLISNQSPKLSGKQLILRTCKIVIFYFIYINKYQLFHIINNENVLIILDA